MAADSTFTAEQARAAIAQTANAPGLLILAGDAQDLTHAIDLQLPTLLLLPLSAQNAELVASRYPADCEVEIIGRERSPDGGPARTVSLTEALSYAGSEQPDDAQAIRLPMLSWEQDQGAFRTLVDIVARLRAPDGCPWDREQTHQSLTPYLIEETYEAVEEIDAHSMPGLREELGDVLLQVALHSEIAKEEGEFTINQVIEGLVRKLVSRHPHVFGDATASTADEVAARWEILKAVEKERDSVMEGVPGSLPALTYAQRTQGRAANVGFDWPDVAGVLDKIAEEAGELVEALAVTPMPDTQGPASEAGVVGSEDISEQEWEIGDLLFSLVNLARRLDIDAEGALRHANRRFVTRFQTMEDLARERGQDLPTMALEAQDALWEEAKRAEKGLGG